MKLPKVSGKWVKWGAIGLGALLVLWWIMARSGSGSSATSAGLVPIGSGGAGGGITSGDQASIFNTLAQVRGASDIASIQAAIEKIRADAAVASANIAGNTAVQLGNRQATASTVNTAIGTAGSVITAIINRPGRLPSYGGGGGYGGYSGGGYFGPNF
jgi:hypothetical protein